MMACWIYRDGEYMLFNDSGAVIATLTPLDGQIHGQHEKRLYEPTRWFRIDGHRIIGKPPDRGERKGA